jgi:DNA-directed RNA polymerase subunit RPC12/RpoP
MSAYEVVHCPDCGLPMRLLRVLPAASVANTDEITYRCDPCQKDIMRQVKPRSLDQAP